MTKTQQLLRSLSDEISSLPIAGYLKEEAISTLKYLHRYKLKNIEKNLTCFCEYLLFLNRQNTDKILALSPAKNSSSKVASRDLSYFLCPDKKLTNTRLQTTFNHLTDQSYELLTLMQGIKGILVLSIDEFCNASSTRMGIHQMLMVEENCISEARPKKQLRFSKQKITKTK